MTRKASTCCMVLLLAGFSKATEGVEASRSAIPFRRLQDTSSCEWDGDCNPGHYCNRGQCRLRGYCEDAYDCMSPANPFDTNECVGHTFCLDNECGIECGNPCPNFDAMECRGRPMCERMVCGDDNVVSCVENNCGGCNAIFFNAAGEQTCTFGEDTVQLMCIDDSECVDFDMFCLEGECKHNGYCQSDDDCDDREYCNRSVCRPRGYCDDVYDCMNPSNPFDGVECVGHKYCKDNQCGMKCSGSHCANYDPFDCGGRPLCERSVCAEEHVSCVENNCGGCATIFFNAAGEQACAFGGDSVTLQCIDNAECADFDMYCLNGECQHFGYCEQNSDCLNPSNKFGNFVCGDGGEVFPMCVDGSCNAVCSESGCPEGGAKSDCYADPCDVTWCFEDPVSCVNTQCGECQGVFFNSTGNRVCEAETPFGGCGRRLTCDQANFLERLSCFGKSVWRAFSCPLYIKRT